MSASACVAYVGIRFEIPLDEVDLLEHRTHPHQQAAKQAGLKSYWGNFSGLSHRLLLFVGAEVGILGPENSARVSLSASRLSELLSETAGALSAANFDGVCALHIEWLEDA
jgi:hypothetical protein